MAIRLLTYTNLNRFNNDIVHFSSTRPGGISTGEYASLNLGNFSDDSRENISQNRQLLCNELKIPNFHLVGAHQVHGKEVKFVNGDVLKLGETDRKTALEGYDALISNTPGICIVATTADCVPVLLYDPATKSIAAIHSGWRSTLQNIVGCTINEMKIRFGSQPDKLVAAIGPCISGAVYEVGPELENTFHINAFKTAELFKPLSNGKFLFDIRMAVQKQLEAIGVLDIAVSSHCTFSEPDLFFSARRQGIHSGRMLSGIMLQS